MARSLAAICLVAILASLGGAASEAGALEAPRRGRAPLPSLPHIVFILADDLGFNDVGFRQNRASSANPRGKATTNALTHTPTLDRLASEGVVLDNYYVQPLCSPTRGALMSGRYPSSTGFGPDVLGGPHGPSAPYGLPAREKLMPEVLNALGYESHMVGKWHLGHCDKRYTPTFRGFRSYTGYLGGAEGYMAPSLVGDNLAGVHVQATDMRTGPACATADGATADGACDVPPPYEKPASVSDADCQSPNSTACYSTIVYAELAAKVIRDFAARRAYASASASASVSAGARAGTVIGRSLFLYLAFQATHNPLTAPDVYREPYDASIADPQRRLLAGMVTALDEAVGNVTAALQQAGLWEDTVVVFSTDNGGEPSSLGRSNNYPLRGGKTTNWEGGVRGTGFIRGTDNRDVAPLPRNVSRTNLMHVTDWLPTFARIAGAGGRAPTSEHPSGHPSKESKRHEGRAGRPGRPEGSEWVQPLLAGLDGVDQWDFLAGTDDGASRPRRTILHNVQPDWATPFVNLPFDAVRVGEWKLHARTPDVAPVTAPPGFAGDPATHVRPVPFADDNGTQWFLFHVPSDPSEATNLAGRHPRELAELVAFYRAAQTTATVDLVRRWGAADPASNPKFRHDKTWGPSNGTNPRCAYGHEHSTAPPSAADAPLLSASAS